MIENIDKSWQGILQKAFDAFEPEYLNYLQNNNGYFPDKNNFLNAFKTLSLEKTQYILFGQDPYPRQESAIGYAFIDGKVQSIFSSSGLSKEVNRATSLRNFVKMLLLCEGELDEDFSKAALSRIDMSRYIQTIHQLRENFEKNGVLLLNMALVFSTKEESKKHIKAWRGFIRNFLAELYKEKKDIELILFGKIAEEVEKLDEAKYFKKHFLPHPYNISFITDSKAHKLFAPMHLLH
jgi:uracil-DNA glycosylase